MAQYLDALKTTVGSGLLSFPVTPFPKDASSMLLKAIVIGALSIVAFAPSASAITPQEIQARGTMVVGVQADQMPWGFINEEGKNDGNDIDVVKLMASELNVNVEFVRITAVNRIPMLLTKKVDFLVPGMSILPERAKVIQYAKPYSTNEIVVYARKELAITKPEDLGGHVIGVARGSAFDTLATKTAPSGTDIRRYDDDASTVQALLTGQADAVLGSITYGVVLGRAGKSVDFENKYKVSDNLLGMAVRPAEKEMLDWLNAFIDRHKADGKLAAIYKKWMLMDLPELPDTVPGISFTIK
jgi:polar amino acid transport system substrate-binding protein